MFMERYEDAVQYFKKANELDPGNAEVRRCLREVEGLEYNQRATLASTMGQPIPKQSLRRPQIPDARFDPHGFSPKPRFWLIEKSGPVWVITVQR